MKGKETNGLIEEMPTIEELTQGLPTIDELIKDIGIIDIGKLELDDLPVIDKSMLDGLEIPDLTLEIPDIETNVPAFDFDIDNI